MIIQYQIASPENIHARNIVQIEHFILMYLHIHVVSVNEKNNKSEKEQGWVYGRAWRDKKEGGVI